MSVRILSGPEEGETANVFASSLWADDQLSGAKEWRDRDLRIAEADSEDPVDETSQLAIEMLCCLVTEDIDFENRETLETVSAQLGRASELGDFHELAYEVDGHAGAIAAPAAAWRGLFEDFARAMPGLVEEKIVRESARWGWVSEGQRASAVARVRLWAGLPPIAPPLEMRTSRLGRDTGGQVDDAIRAAASQSLEGFNAPDDHAASLDELFRGYRKSRGELGEEEHSFLKEMDARSQIREFAQELVDVSKEPAGPMMRWLMREVEIRGEFCDHIVWSDYTAQHPRTLHLFPDGHLSLGRTAFRGAIRARSRHAVNRSLSAGATTDLGVGHGMVNGLSTTGR